MRLREAEGDMARFIHCFLHRTSIYSASITRQARCFLAAATESGWDARGVGGRNTPPETRHAMPWLVTQERLGGCGPQACLQPGLGQLCRIYTGTLWQEQPRARASPAGAHILPPRPALSFSFTPAFGVVDLCLSHRLLLGQPPATTVLHVTGLAAPEKKPL